MNAIYTSWGVCVCKQNKKHVELKQSNKQTFFVCCDIIIVRATQKGPCMFRPIKSTIICLPREGGRGKWWRREGKKSNKNPVPLITDMFWTNWDIN